MGCSVYKWTTIIRSTNEHFYNVLIFGPNSEIFHIKLAKLNQLRQKLTNALHSLWPTWHAYAEQWDLYANVSGAINNLAGNSNNQQSNFSIFRLACQNGEEKRHFNMFWSIMNVVLNSHQNCSITISNKETQLPICLVGNKYFVEDLDIPCQRGSWTITNSTRYNWVVVCKN